jgi:hypothetical protein
MIPKSGDRFSEKIMLTQQVVAFSQGRYPISIESNALSADLRLTLVCIAGWQAIAMQIDAVNVEPDLGALGVRAHSVHQPPEPR